MTWPGSCYVAFAKPSHAMYNSCSPVPQPPISEGTTVIGAAEIAQLRREFPGEGIREVFQMFQEEAPAIVAQLMTAVRQINLDAVRRAAHALKGCCDNFGAQPMAVLCRKSRTTHGPASCQIPRSSRENFRRNSSASKARWKMNAEGKCNHEHTLARITSRYPRRRR